MKCLTAVLVGFVVMWASGSALANSSTCQAYNPQQCNATGGTETTTSGAAATTSGVESSGALPFTGLDIGLLAIGGGVLVAGGAVVRSRIRAGGN